MSDTVQPLDATDTTQIIQMLQEYINSLNILDSHLYLEFSESDTGFGYVIKADGGSITDEDILGNFTATQPFIIYYKTNFVTDSIASCKPLNDLSAHFKKNGVIGLDIGERRVPDEIITLKGATDLSGQDEDGNVTFFSVYSLTYDENVNQ